MLDIMKKPKELCCTEEWWYASAHLHATVVQSPKSAQRNEGTLVKRVCRRDVEKWIRDFELIASCNGIKRSAHLVTALGALLYGRARAAYDLNLGSNRAMDYENLKAALVAEFSKEDDLREGNEPVLRCGVQPD
ncbi:unnamed protein product [Echinostoma caproni]|uniref:Reverse transcriptase Ty1/copia-type domain-containing protein n=1 Tax=Echinostoma caproni TaxID=27848 RepID=A0A183AF14_9TREM|nr:unnamed protein product [Echinostoma caproni]